MKLQLLSRWSFGLLTLLAASNLYAQEVKELPTVTVKATTNVNQTVSNVFQTDFKDAVNPKWYKIDKDYLVQFIKGDMKNNALYRKNGYMIYHIAYGNEKNLPDDVRKIVKSNYVDYTITNAINVHQDNRNIWVVNMEDSKHLVIVRVENGEIEEVGNYDRQQAL